MFKKYFLFILLNLILIIFPNLTLANSSMPKVTMPQINIDIGEIKNKLTPVNCPKSGNCEIPWISQYIMAVYQYSISIIGILSTVAIMIGGLIWLTAGGNNSRVSEAQDWINRGVSALVIIMCSFLILKTISFKLLELKPISLKMIEKMDISPEAIKFSSSGGVNNVTQNNNNFDEYLKKAANKYGIDCTLIKAFMLTESSGNPNAISPKGAIGLMQLMPETARDLGYNIDDIKNNPEININAGTKYLNRLKKTACNGKEKNEVCDTSNAIYIYAAYNGGPGANKPSTSCPGVTFWQCTNNSGYEETRKYVEKIDNNYQKLKNSGWGC